MFAAGTTFIRPLGRAAFGALAAAGLLGLVACGESQAKPPLTFEELSACARESLAIDAEQKRIRAEVRALRARHDGWNARFEAIERERAPTTDPRRTKQAEEIQGLNREISALMASNQDLLERTDARNVRCGGRDISDVDRARLPPELRRAIPGDSNNTGGAALSREESLACARRATVEEAEIARLDAARAEAKAGRLDAAELAKRINARYDQMSAFDFECRLQPHAPEYLADLPPELQAPLARAMGFRAPGDTTGGEAR